MKKIFSLAIALIATIGFANAQEHRVMEVNYPDGTYTQYNVDEIASVSYSYYPWEYIGIGNYRFNGIYQASTSYRPSLDIERGVYDPSQWQILNVFWNSTPFSFTYDEETGEVYLPEQSTGIWGTATTTSGNEYEGYLMICEANLFLSRTGREESEVYKSYYDPESDTFYFAIAYYMYTGETSIASMGWSGGTNSYGQTYGFEQFKITNREQGAPAKRVIKKGKAEKEKWTVSDPEEIVKK